MRGLETKMSCFKHNALIILFKSSTKHFTTLANVDDLWLTSQ